LPGWDDTDTIWGFGILWKDDIVNALFIGTYCWGDIAMPDWFRQSPADGEPVKGQLLLIPSDEPTPDPTPSAVTGAGPGEICFNGEQIALLLPGFNDTLAKIWRPVAHTQRLSLIAKPLAGWTPTPKELEDWAKNC
jgi:hypothetical protein